MPDLTISFVCLGLFVYWGARTILLLHATEEVIDATLRYDLSMGRKLLLALR